MIRKSTQLLLIAATLGLSLASSCRLASKSVDASALHNTEQDPPSLEGLRPHIDNIKEQAMPQREPLWRSQLEALTLLTAQVSAMNPGAEIYYLARDMEYAYDLSQLLGDAKTRSHLLKLSRSNAKNERTPEYLKQEGISEDSLSQGKKVVLVDSGWRGSIPKYLKNLFSTEAGKNLKTQLLHSRNGDFASTSVALAALNPTLVRVSPNDAHDEVVKIERLPHFESRYEAFEEAVDPATNDRSLKPRPKTQGEAKEMGDPKNAIVHMSDLKAWAKEKTNIELFEKWSSFWQQAHQSIQQNNPEILAKAIETIYNGMNTYKERSLLEGALKDLAERSSLGQIENAAWLQQKYAEYSDRQYQEHSFRKSPGNVVHQVFASKNYKILGDFAAESMENGQLVFKGLFAYGLQEEMDTENFKDFFGKALRKYPENAEYILTGITSFSLKSSDYKIVVAAVEAIIESTQTPRQPIRPTASSHRKN